jgi:hypothetical protein
MEINEIAKSHSDTENPRVTIYLNEDSISSYYHQRVGAIETSKSETVVGNVSAYIFEAAKEFTREEKVCLTHELKAVLIENIEKKSKQLVDIKSEIPNNEKLLKYIGDSYFLFKDVDVSQENKLPENVSKIIQDERKSQESFIKLEDEKLGTIVWVAKVKNYYIAAIASTKWINFGNFGSYGGHPPFGVLGRYEAKKDNVFFVAPYWIWHENS